ncbi:MAG: sensor histidine kinase [Thermodesulfobacterium sp.]|nr:sensor histidine kinase [Thermodesulfobacterium sp.]
MKIIEFLKNWQNKIFNFRKKVLFVWNRFSIRKKIFVSFLVIVFIITFLTDFLILDYQKRSFKTEIHKKLKSDLDALNYEIIDYVIFLNPLKLDKKVSLLMQNPGIKYVMIVDQNGRIIAHSNRKKLGTYIKILPDSFTYWEKEDSGIKIINIPIFKTSYPLGIIRVGISEEEVNNYIEMSSQNLRNYVFVISVFIVLLTLLISYFLANTLTNPLSRLKEKMANLRTDRLELCENENLIRCKDFYRCNQIDCPAYGKTRCWLIYEASEICKKIHNIECHECFVYKISCGDEIGYLIETFNEMIIKLKKSLEELERTNLERIKLEKTSAVAEMSMIVAHEIKNPLNAIKAASNYLKNNFKGKILNEFLCIIDKEVNRLNELINSFLSYARPLSLRLEKNNINEVLKEVIKLVRPEIEEEGKVLKTKFDWEIPDFYFDAPQIKQAILNLLINAQEATKEGDIILILTEKKDNFVKIVVKDTGVGISEDKLDKIFEPFYTTKTTGSGLGLACVERIVKEHEGKIEVKSIVGKGTEFIIKLPLKV